jgi:glycosyltransferase involved in cell wall biosynthesis
MAKKLNEKTGLSVLMSVYQKDKPQWLDEAIASIVNQTKRPDEIVLVQDGPLTSQLGAVVNQWVEKYPDLFKIVPLEKNNGLGPALMAGMENCSCEIVARMDADDLSTSDRFEKQFSFLARYPEIDLVSSRAGQFDTNPDQIIFERGAPSEHREIARMARFRNPIEHGTVMYRREKVLAAGGYHNIKGFEDYHLWVRMLLNGAQMACIPEVLYKFRREDMYLRRGGLRMVSTVGRLQREFLKMGFISHLQFFSNITVRTIAYLLPVRFVGIIRTKLLKL